MSYFAASDEARLPPRLDLSSGSLDAVAVPPFQLREMIRIVYRRRLLVVVLASLGLLAAIAVNATSKRMYSSTVTVEVNQQAGSGVGLNDLSGMATQSVASEEQATALATQEAIVKSGSVALNVIKELNLTSRPPYSIPTDPATLQSPLGRERGLPLDRAPLQVERVLGIFDSRMKVGLVRDTTLLTVTYTDRDPEVAARVANAIITAYTMEYSRARYAASERAFMGLADQLADLKNEVIDSERKVSEFEQKTGLVSPVASEGSATAMSSTGADAVSTGRFLELNRELTAAQVSRIAREAIYRMTQAHDPDLVLGETSAHLASDAGAGSVLAPGSADLALLASLREQKSKLAIQRATETAKYGARNPLLIELRDQGNELNAQIQTELVRIQERAKSDFELSRANEEGLRAQVARQQQEVTKVSSNANQLLLLEQEQLSSRQLYQDLYSKLQEARVASGLRNSNVTVVDPARVSTVPSTPKTNRILTLGVLLGGTLGVFLAFLLDLLDDSLSSVDQIARLTPLPILANVPLVRTAGNARLKRFAGMPVVEGVRSSGLMLKAPTPTSAWLLKAPNSPAAEAIRSLRSGLLLGNGRRVRSILFTSLASGDGKSTICFNTAVAFALQGRRVLLVDADMRRPRLQLLTGASNELGLSQYLPGRMPLRDVVQPCVGIKNLFILPSGGTSVIPSELLGSSRFAELLDGASSEYDYVMIDSPALLSVTDALVVSSLADRTLMIVRSGKSMGAMLRKALTNPILETSRLRLVLNGVDLGSPDLYHGVMYESGATAT